MSISCSSGDISGSRSPKGALPSKTEPPSKVVRGVNTVLESLLRVIECAFWSCSVYIASKPGVSDLEACPRSTMPIVAG